LIIHNVFGANVFSGMITLSIAFIIDPFKGIFSYRYLTVSENELRRGCKVFSLDLSLSVK
jgi:hypothetical protein